MIPRYRTWDKTYKTMYEADDIMYIDFEEKQICVKALFFERASLYDFDDIVLMQSTGLKDKNSKEVFEGDIVRTTRFLGRADEIGGFYEYEKDYLGVVKVLEGSWVIDTGSDAVNLWSEIEENEVLGNIYENRELLEDKE